MGRQSLQIVFNVLSNDCGGCQYESYPYKAQIPIKINGKYQTYEFKSDKDVWKVVDLLIKDTIESNQNSENNFNIIDSVVAQISFFACKNIFIDKEVQKDIQRYVYCTDNNVPPYEGGYDKQPALWVDRYFTIKKALAKKEKAEIEKTKKDK